MKKKLRLFSLALSMIMALSSSATVFAAEPETANFEVSDAAITSNGADSTNGFGDGALRTTTIYNNFSFTFQHHQYSNTFYARKGYISVEIKSSAPSGYGGAPLLVDFCKSNRERVALGSTHKGTDSWRVTYDVPADGNYCLSFANGLPYGEYYDFTQRITMTVVNVYPLTN